MLNLKYQNKWTTVGIFAYASSWTAGKKCQPMKTVQKTLPTILPLSSHSHQCYLKPAVDVGHPMKPSPFLHVIIREATLPANYETNVKILLQKVKVLVALFSCSSVALFLVALQYF